MKKGIELPINVLVVVAVAVIVLIGMVALYMAGFFPFQKGIGSDAAKNAACNKLLRQNNCAIDTNTIKVNFDADNDGVIGGGGDTLENLCINYYGCTGSDTDKEICCKKLCGCQVGG